jgi:propionyl-CoA carboxylase beta chain
MGAKGAAEIIFKKEIAAAEDSEALTIQKEQEYKIAFAHPFQAAQRGFIDEVIQPDKTRLKLIKAFSMLKNKKVPVPNRKHGNIPL